MPQPTPFHPRTSKLCTSYRWKEWAGYHAVCSYETCHDREYFAFRHAAGLLDVSPLYKYEVRGVNAGNFLSRVMVRNIKKMRIGRVLYTCWCDPEGKVVDDGTVSRMSDDHFRVTSALPMYSWFHRYTRGYDVTIEDITDQTAALSLQGPNSRDILKQVTDADLEKLNFFGWTHAKLDKFDITLSRTGYTGDLGYEIWVKNDSALGVWDALMDAGQPRGLLAVGLDALDMTRVEAGFVLNGIDYKSSLTCLIESQKSSPYEIGLGWAVKLDREPFVGQDALRAEQEKGSSWVLRGLEVDWDEFEALHREFGLPPHVPSGAWRTAVPIYNSHNKHIGQATSGSWSPLLKRNLALATLHAPYGKIGTKLRMEMTVEYERRTVTATVVDTPFFNPERKKA